ncbi:MAG: GTP-binding protein, partial [Acidimicrobiales bacterium]
MKTFPPAKIRNVALVGHGGSGKTSLAEALLWCSGTTARLGRVDDGSSTCDFEPEEVRRRLSVSMAVAPFEHRGHKVNLLDTPGYADFAHEVTTALSVADMAVFVISAVDGVEVGTESAWAQAAALGLPRMIFINKLDRERADFQATLESLRESFGAGVAPLELPIGSEGDLRGVADLLSDAAFLYERGSDGRAQVRQAEVPDDMGPLEHQVREALVEGIVVADDALMERYLEGDVPLAKELEDTMAKGVAQASVFPVVCGSATGLVAIDRLADFLCELGPSPLDRRAVMVSGGDATHPVAADPSGQPLARVFRTIADPYVGKISVLQVLSGTLRPDVVLTSSRTHAEERLHSLFNLRGKEQDAAVEAPAGDIVAVARLGDVATGDTLAPKGAPVWAPSPVPPTPLLSVAIRPRSKGDED